MGSNRTNAWAIALLATSLLLAPPATAGEPNLPDCEDVTVEDAAHVPELDAYAWDRGDTVEVWWETNDLPGLQTQACNEQGVAQDADEFETEVDAPTAGEVVEWLLEQCASSICVL